MGGRNLVAPLAKDGKPSVIGIYPLQGFLDGAGFRPSTACSDLSFESIDLVSWGGVKGKPEAHPNEARHTHLVNLVYSKICNIVLQETFANHLKQDILQEKLDQLPG